MMVIPQGMIFKSVLRKVKLDKINAEMGYLFSANFSPKSSTQVWQPENYKERKLAISDSSVSNVTGLKAR